MNTAHLAHQFATRPMRAPVARPVLPKHEPGFVLLVRNAADEVLIEFTQNANIRVSQMVGHDLVIMDKRHHYSVTARRLVDDLHSIFRRQRVYHDADWFAIDWTEANQTLDAVILGATTAQIGRGRRAA